MQYRLQGKELQRSASRHNGQLLTGQQTNPAHSVRNCAKQDRQRVPEMQQRQQQQQQLDVGLPVAAAVDAVASSGHHGHADLTRLVAAPEQQSHQLNARSASSDAFEASVSAQPGSGSGGAGAGLHAQDMADDMCDPMELTWEGVLQAASVNGQEPHAPGDALHPCSSRMKKIGQEWY